MTFAEFWPYYLSQHRAAGNRALHFVGTTAGLLLVVSAAVSRRPALAALAPAAGYAFAWAGHVFVEKNAPATFGHPLLSLVADLKMYGLMWRGRLWRD